MLVVQLTAEKITSFFESDKPLKKISMLGQVSNFFFAQQNGP